MNKFESFNEFLATQSAEVEILAFIASLILATILALFLGRLYVKYGVSLSNRKNFARNFVLISMTTMVIITIVKSSLALSLGLVGALSIVRFRAAIKEPEELAYLFLAIAIGLGCGANQWKITLIGFLIISSVIVLTKLTRRNADRENLHLTITSRGENRLGLAQIQETLTAHCRAINLKRFDVTSDVTEASFIIEADGFEQVNRLKDELLRICSTTQITFMDNRGLA